MNPIIQSEELLQLSTNENMVLVDASTGKNTRSNYDAKHLDRAIFVDLNTQLAEIKDDVSDGGRHPLPKIGNFTKTLSDLGISSKSHVVVYDDSNGSNAAARFWWMLKSIGHEKVQVLNGGIKAAEQIAYPINSKTVVIAQAEVYKVDSWKLPVANIAEVENASQNTNHMIIDVRSVERYNGETEPIDLVAGHIPGAINIPFTENLDENNLFLSPNELKKKYEKLLKKKPIENIIVHCGSGVTACHTILAIASAGLGIPKLYVGSWSEWSRNNKTIAAKD